MFLPLTLTSENTSTSDEVVVIHKSAEFSPGLMIPMFALAASYPFLSGLQVTCIPIDSLAKVQGSLPCAVCRRAMGPDTSRLTHFGYI